MKNIHILPTDKPSILIKDIWKNTFSLVENFDTSHTDFKAQHIYITSDEEITEGDWFYDLDTKYVKIKQSFENSHLDFNGKKIILSTDIDLIEDGVQAINDEFLEWIVKNPSCEDVEVAVGYNQVNQDETEHLLSTEANKKRLLGDIKQAEKSDKMPNGK